MESRRTFILFDFKFDIEINTMVFGSEAVGKKFIALKLVNIYILKC